jgi:hypothetical protein
VLAAHAYKKRTKPQVGNRVDENINVQGLD